MAGASASLTAYAVSSRDAAASALKAAEAAAQVACKVRHPAAEKLDLSDARWVQVPH